ncbi:hypothetical protein ONS96_001824 [Cadophora gregata f. sp. sojae]|nr:hypothetical protein ONS96_001824 [Cadophora gregata f. sp. sojae]
MVFWTRKRNAVAYPTSSADNPSTRSTSREPKVVRSTIRGLVDDTRLVKSHIATHSAVELCESPTSAGLHFVSFVEGRFCDMRGRIVCDLCDETLLEKCFDADAGEVRFGDLARGVVKEYTKIVEWASELLDRVWTFNVSW